VAGTTAGLNKTRDGRYVETVCLSVIGANSWERQTEMQPNILNVT